MYPSSAVLALDDDAVDVFVLFQYVKDIPQNSFFAF